MAYSVNSFILAILMLTTLNDTIVYNDSLVCREVNYYRLSQEQLMPELNKTDENKEVIFNLYPNPGKDKLYITFEGSNLQAGEIAFYNSLGSKISSYLIKKETKIAEIDVSTLAEGFYIIGFTTGKVRINKSYIKLK
ncbi:MAG: T9SS type A sorting domain-containing protein [Bacteroidia bacterium]|nr:T9SS type A sorting domain-containing protein [Bacteroidia bacterium]